MRNAPITFQSVRANKLYRLSNLDIRLKGVLKALILVQFRILAGLQISSLGGTLIARLGSILMKKWGRSNPTANRQQIANCLEVASRLARLTDSNRQVGLDSDTIP